MKLSRRRFLVDENLTITPRLSRVAESIVVRPGREICAKDLRDIDVLLVRSVTPVNKSLLADSNLKFIGTATAGTDHIDVACLQARQIPFASAPGSNAVPVAEYVMTALSATGFLQVAHRSGVGVVGMGNVGKALSRILVALGIRVCAHDPLCTAWPEEVDRATLEQVLALPVVTLHAALHATEPYPSANLLSLPVCKPLTNGQLLINAGRGGLVSREYLDACYSRGATLVLDAWPDEPRIDADLLRMVAFGSPHIAGYSEAAKARATDQLLDAMATLGLIEAEQGVSGVGEPIAIPDPVLPDLVWLDRLLKDFYNLRDDFSELRKAADEFGVVSGPSFDALRKNYKLRGELSGSRANFSGLSGEKQNILRAFGIIEEE